MKPVDTLLAVISDTHTGSSTALFPRGGFRNSEGNVVLPNDKQKAIYPTFVRFSGEVAKDRKGCKLILVMLGDAVDGFHHGSMQESLFMSNDQCDAHIHLMRELMKKVGWRSDDELYYVRGTESHVGNTENVMAKELGAIQNEFGNYVHEVLNLNINGISHAFFHHGKARGKGANEGNSLRNYLRDIRYDRRKDSLHQLDVVWSGHTHGHSWETHKERQPDGNFHEFHGIICPSFQSKTVYANGKVPMEVNSVGGTRMFISADGKSRCVPVFTVMPTRDG